MQIMWLLLIGGVFLVCFASLLGQGLVPRHEYAPGNYEWNTDDGREIAVVVRLLGVMAFAAGLVERLVITIRHGREAGGNDTGIEKTTPVPPLAR